jgi:hypothetical protein
VRIPIAILATLFLVSTYTFAADDPITQLTDDLRKNPLWQNGHFNPIELPETAKAEELLKEFFKEESAPHGYINDYSIEELKQVRLNNSSYTAALVSSDQGGQIILFRYWKEFGGWWARMYGARYFYKNK